MMREVPVRDTDPDPYNNNNLAQEEDRSSPIAFTVDFGDSGGSQEEKSRKLERFALRSSQRKMMQSPVHGAKHREPSRQDSKGKILPSLKINQDIRRGATCDRISSGKGPVDFSQEKHVNDDEDDYVNDTFESDCSDEAAEEKNGSHPSETGTYTVDKEEDDSPTSIQEEPRLDSLLCEAKSSYVEEWATKHAAYCQEPSPCESPDTESRASSKATRRLLPSLPPGSDPQQSSLESPEHDSEDESGYMTHTKHLVDAMELRLKQKSLKKLESSNRGLVSRNLSAGPKQDTRKPLSKTSSKGNIKSPEPQMEALEAWKRRKNYDPLAAAGRKPVSRKLSASSSSKSGLVSPPQDDTSECESVQRQKKSSSRQALGSSRQSSSAPSSAKSRSSGSSGYASRSFESRPDKSSTPSRPTSGPARRSLAQSNTRVSSASGGPRGSSRSTSSLTSKEAEFQAWKRRKDYNPMKSASSRPRESKEPRKASSSSSKSFSLVKDRQSPRHKRILEMTSREMTKSLIMEDVGSETPMQRSNSFHSAKNRFISETESEDDYGSGYESSLMSESQMRSYPHFYLDDDELIMPLQPLPHPRSNTMSPSKSRSKLEALDTLVISTIHNVSNKLCSNGASVLRQAASVFPDHDEEQASMLETVIYLLEDTDLPSSPSKKTSRELSGTLRNLKKIEQCLEMMKKLMQTSEEDEQ